MHLNGERNYICYTPTKSEGYSFGVVRASVRQFRPSVRATDMDLGAVLVLWR